MNIYRYAFTCHCPVNDDEISYSMEIRSVETIYAEKIVAACRMWKQGIHEEIADGLSREFPNSQQVIKGHHGGVDIETRRGV